MLIATSQTFQYLFDGVVNGALYGLVGLSFGLIVAVTRRFHFAWAVAFAISGYFTAYLSNHQGLPVLAAATIALLGAILFSVALELFVYRPVAARSSGDPLLPVFVASFGATIACQSLIPLIVQARISSETLSWIPIDPQEVGGVAFTNLDLIAFGSFWLCAVLTWALLRFTGLGRAIRAVTVNPSMAQAVGIRTERIYVAVFAIGTLVAGIAALFVAMQNAAAPEMGTRPVFIAFVVAFLAGLGSSPLRAMAVGTALGVAESMSAEVFSTQWQTVVVFAILLALLALKAARAWRPTLFRPPTFLAR